MDPDQTPIQSKEAPFISDSKDDASPPKKRGKHGSDFDSPEQTRVLEFDLPKRKPGRKPEWLSMFLSRFYKSVPSQVFWEMIPECEEEINALKEAHRKAKLFLERESEELKKKQHCDITYEVLEALHGDEKTTYSFIFEAEKMLTCFKEDMGNFIRIYRDEILSNCDGKRDSYHDNLAQLANIPGVDTMIKFLMYGDVDHVLIREHTGLAPVDVIELDRILHEKNKIKFSIEECNVGKEQFGYEGMNSFMQENKVAMEIFCIARDAFVEAEADVDKYYSDYGYETCLHMTQLLNYLQRAGLKLGIMRKQLNLLSRKNNQNVIVNGYPVRFVLDLADACYGSDD